MAWPYTVHQIQDTLDVELIEARGKQLLFQAINSENLTAFLGSGAAAAYGRHSWTSWRETQIGVVRDHAEHFLKVAKASRDLIGEQARICDPKIAYWKPGDPVDKFTCPLKRLAVAAGMPDVFDLPAGDGAQTAGLGMAGKRNLHRWFKNRMEVLTYAINEVEDLFKTFKLGNSKGDFPGGESLPVQFEIAQQLHGMLRSHAGLYLPSDLHDAGLGFRKAKEISKERCGIGLWADEQSSTAPNRIIEAFIPARDAPSVGAVPEFNGLVSLVEKFRSAHEAYLDVATKPQSHASFEDLTKLLLLDEAALAEKQVDDALGYGKKEGRADESAAPADAEAFWDRRKSDFEARRRNLRRDILGIRQDSELYHCMVPYKVSNVRKIVELARDAGIAGWDDALSAIDNHCRRIGEDQGRIFLTPSIRFLVGVLLRLLPDPFGNSELRTLLKEQVTPADFTSRDSILAPHLDPVRKLALDMNIRRFLTTNYDFEIERFFQDIGYHREIRTSDRAAHQLDNRPPPMAPDDPRTSGLGRVMRDMTFRREAASDLFRFAAGADGANVSVFHLHGRATAEDGVVVTERDYMDLYLREDAERDLVDEGIRLAFSANPILFLGLGMTEADVLRPLRQFMSNHDRAIPHRSIVLMPAEKGADDRAKTSAGLFLRYGTHTVFYGMAAISMDGEEKPRTVDWMHRMLSVVSELWEINNGSLEKAQKGVSPISGRIAKPRITKACGDLKQDQLFDPTTLVPYHVDLVIGQEIAGRDRVSVNTKDYFAVTFELFGQVMRQTMTQPVTTSGPELIRDLQARLALLDGLRSAIFTSCFNAALEGLRKEWGSWWKQWQQSPPHRLARFEEVRPPLRGRRDLTPGCYLPFPRRFVRHSVLTPMSDRPWLSQSANFPDKTSITRVPTRYHAFDQFIEAIAESFKTAGTSGLLAGSPGKYGPPKPKFAKGRRLYTVAAGRGLGKGAFMAAFTSDLGLANYLHAAWPAGLTPQPLFVNACFVNLSFGTEIASVYDMLLDVFFQSTITLRASVAHDSKTSRDRFARCAYVLSRETTPTYVNIVHARANLFDAPADEVRKDLTAAAAALAGEVRDLSRTFALRHIMDAFRKASEAYTRKTDMQPRGLLVLQSAELLFYRGGLSKNREIDQIIRYLITSPKGAHLPLDLIVVGNENVLGEPWRSGPRKRAINKVKKELSKGDAPATRRHWATPPARIIGARGQQEDRPDAARHEGEQARAIQSGMADLTDIPATGGPASTHQIHFAQPMRPERFLIDNFPTLALALFANEAQAFFESHNRGPAVRPICWMRGLRACGRK
ncbi:SIR2 family protein [Sulfitobacter albidus]|uniref:SIR2 family protein n=1 Tax=Sulfitobacter albidus TaxID=2829501 RepID=A0A975JCN7_9RHOB|nr:SIR2 family protein [Sulfitobacter albidus]QUJ75912.1 SIR2 family protein [Sulfitobacter albidus]